MKVRWIHSVMTFWIASFPLHSETPIESDKIIGFINVNLVPMTEETILPNQTVLVQGTHILSVGPSEQISIPKYAKTIDGSNLYLMPGLADMHMHAYPNWLDGKWPVSPLALYLANGVTTIRILGSSGHPIDYALQWRRDILNGTLQGPTIYTAGQIFNGNEENPQEAVLEQKTLGFDFIKVYSFLSQASLQSVIETAKKQNLHVVGHIPFSIGLEGVLSVGMNEIAHIEELDFEFFHLNKNQVQNTQEWFQYLIQTINNEIASFDEISMEHLKARYQSEATTMVRLLKKTNTYVNTTLSVDDIIDKKLFKLERHLKHPTTKYLPPDYIESVRSHTNRHQVQLKDNEYFSPFHFTLNKFLLQKLHQGGVPLVLGTDAGGLEMGLVPGFSVHDELQIMVENGFTPFEAIKTATINAARVVNQMNQPSNFGTIEAGNKADLILIEGNPLKNLGHIKKIHGVMVCGRWLDKTQLNKMIMPKPAGSESTKKTK